MLPLRGGVTRLMLSKNNLGTFRGADSYAGMFIGLYEPGKFSEKISEDENRGINFLLDDFFSGHGLFMRADELDEIVAESLVGKGAARIFRAMPERDAYVSAIVPVCGMIRRSTFEGNGLDDTDSLLENLRCYSEPIALQHTSTGREYSFPYMFAVQQSLARLGADIRGYLDLPEDRPRIDCSFFM